MRHEAVLCLLFARSPFDPEGPEEIMNWQTILMAGMSFTHVACFSSSVSPELVQAKAASDFECSAEKVQVRQVNDGNWKATGCGKKSSYVCSGSNFMSEGVCLREGSMP